jgi:hypothetical protein
MSNYTITTNFTAKDNLPAGDPGKLIRGEDFGVEFTNIATAINDNAVGIASLEGYRSSILATTTELSQLSNAKSNIQAQLDENLFDFDLAITAIYGSADAKQDGGIFLHEYESFQSGSGQFIDIAHPSATVPSSSYIAFSYAGNRIGSIIASGTTGVAYLTSSDYRLKENVAPVDNASARVKALKPCRFNFIGEERTVDGFLAHEAQEVVPESVAGDKDAVDADGKPMYQGIDQSKLVPLLTAALQEALERIEALEGVA